MTVRYLKRQKSGLYYYRRDIPKDLRETYGKTSLKHSLKTYNEQKAIREAQILTRRYDDEFKQLRGTTEREQAVKLLKEYHLEPVALERQEDIGDPEFSYYDQFIEDLGDSLTTHYEATPSGYRRHYQDPSPAEQRALDILNGKENPTLDDIQSLYLKNVTDKKVAGNIKRQFGYFTKALKSCKLGDIRTRDVQSIVEELAQDYSQDTYKKAVGTVRKAVKKAIVTYDLNLKNPFEDIDLPKSLKESTKRHTFSLEELELIREAVRATPSAIGAQLAGLLIETGCRCGELGGLKLSDIYLDYEIPHIRLTDAKNRKLKTPQSNRCIPLTGVSLEIANYIIEHSTPEQVYAFPRYNKDDDYNNNNATQALNKWLKTIVNKGTTHSFRHSMNSRLFEAGAPDLETNSLLGWATESMISHYGLKDGLDRLRRALDKTHAHEAKRVNISHKTIKAKAGV